MIALSFIVAPISLGPVSLSLPELAQALTKAGMPTEASPSLKDRGAFVCLKGRSPEAVRKLLGEALGVAFRPEEGAWRMVVDPDARDRDRLLLVGYKRQAIEAARAWAAERDRLRAGRSHARIEADVVETGARLFKLPANDPRLDGDVPAFFETAMLLGPAAWIGVSTARDAQKMGAVIERSFELNMTPEEARRRYGLPIFRPESGGTVRTLRLSALYTPETGKLSIDAAAYGEEKGAFARFQLGKPWRGTIANTTFAMFLGGGEATFFLEGKSLAETFSRMGPLAQAYWRGFAPVASLPDVPLAPERGSATLSKLMEAFGEKGAEAVMELSPRFEMLPDPLPVPLSLRQALTAREKPLKTIAPVPAWAAKINGDLGRSAAARDRAFPWRPLQRDGVWLIVDPLAFLDRIQPISPVPYLLIERALPRIPADAPAWLTGYRLPTWEWIATLAPTLSPDADLTHVGYRGVTAIGSVAGLLRLAQIVDSLLVADRQALWRDSKTNEGGTVPYRNGSLHLNTETIRPYQSGMLPIGRVDATWTRPDGTVENFRGFIDPRGSSD